MVANNVSEIFNRRTSFFILIVVCGFLYLEHVKHISEKEIAKTKEALSRVEPISPVQHNQPSEKPDIDIVEQTDVPTIDINSTEGRGIDPFTFLTSEELLK